VLRIKGTLGAAHFVRISIFQKIVFIQPLPWDLEPGPLGLGLGAWNPI